MNIKEFRKKYFFKLRTFMVLITAMVFLYALYFYEKGFVVSKIGDYIMDYDLYLALAFSVLGTLLVCNILFNKKNIENALK